MCGKPSAYSDAGFAAHWVSIARRSASAHWPADEARLTEDIIALTEEFGRYGYRMITGMLNNSGSHVNHKRVERIWRREGRKSHRNKPRKVGSG